MKKILLTLLILMLFFLLGCSGGEGIPGVKSKKIDGVVHVYNSSQPLKGVIKLEAVKQLEIDADNVNEGNASFSRVRYGKRGEIYIGDPKNIHIYRFDKDGKLLNTLLRKGNGPGEFPSLPGLYVLDDGIWAIHTRARKIARFDFQGKLMEERKLSKSGHGYLFVEIVDENRFMANYNRYEGESKEQKRFHVLGLMDNRENTLKELFEEPGIGYTEVKSEHVNFAFILPIISPLLLHHYNRGQYTFYMVLTNNYRIFLKDFEGKTQRVIHRQYIPIAITPGLRDEIMDLPMFRRSHPLERKAIINSLPDKLSVIKRFRVLDSGALAIYRIAGLEAVEIDIFDKDGRFIYTVTASDQFPELDKLEFFSHGVGVISQQEDKHLYIYYRVSNLPGVFTE